MNKLFDLRFVIGLFFVLAGLLLLAYALLAGGAALNGWCGALFLLFGGSMVGLSYLRKDGSA